VRLERENNLGYEAVGEVHSHLEKFADWKQPRSRWIAVGCVGDIAKLEQLVASNLNDQIESRNSFCFGAIDPSRMGPTAQSSISER
jgi:hypothetical protein